MHIIKNILNEIYKVLSDYAIDLNRSEFDALSLPIINDKGELDRDSYKVRCIKSIKIINRILDVNGKAEIVKPLGMLARIEYRNRDLLPRVRDHVVHAIYTFLVGAYIIEKIDMPKNVEGRNSFPFMWKLCGPVHDIGYAIEISRNIENEFLDEVNAFLEKMHVASPKVSLRPFQEELAKLANGRDANELIQQRLDEWALGINIKDYLNWLCQKNKTDHGVIGALAELKMIDAIYQNKNPNRDERDIIIGNLNYNEQNFTIDIVSAASALFIHNIDLNYPGFSNKIDFQIAPMAFMLFLCDTFQEWDRYTEKRPVYSGDLFDIACTRNSVSLYVPSEIETKISEAIHQRLVGLTIKVNGRLAVS